MTVTSHQSVADLDESLFDGASLYESRDWLRYCELLSGNTTTYLVARDDAGVACGLTTARTVRPGQVMAVFDLGTMFGDARPADLYPYVVASVSGSHYVDRVVPGADAAGTRAALGAALADQGPAVAAALFVGNEDTATQLSSAMGASPPFTYAAQTVLTADWPEFDGYLASLSRSRRNKVRRELRECADGGVRITAHPGMSGLDEDTARLQLQLRDKYSVGGSIDGILADYDKLRATVGDRVVAFRAEHEGRLVGMSLALLDGDRLHLRLVGFDYTRKVDFLYFNVLFYAPIEWGSRHGITSYAFGTSSYAGKLARGCAAVPLYGVVRWPAADRAACEKQATAHEEALLGELGVEAS